MSSHRIQPEPRVVISRVMAHLMAQLAPLAPIIQKAMEAQREQRQLIVLWSPDPPSVPAGHVYRLPSKPGPWDHPERGARMVARRFGAHCYQLPTTDDRQTLTDIALVTAQAHLVHADIDREVDRILGQDRTR
jgi:hypothetical protein